MTHYVSLWHFVLNSTSGHMRWDRFVTVNLVSPLVQYGLMKPHPGIPILMYHSISDGPEENVSPYYRTCTRHSRFREHLALLKSAGYQGVTLTAGLAWLQAITSPSSVLSAPTPPRPVVLTFDDGFRDFYTAAFPVLQEFGFSATMYLPTAFIQDPGPRTNDHGPTTAKHELPSRPRPGRQQGKVSSSHPFVGKKFLTWPEVRQLHAAGIEFGSHTVNHPKLVDLDWPEIESEISKSKSEIKHQLGAPVTSFAYPYAFPQADKNFVEAFRQLLKRVGYESCVTTEVGRVRSGGDRFRLSRLPVNSADDDDLLLGKLAGNYDWLAFPQALVKKMNTRFARRANRPMYPFKA